MKLTICWAADTDSTAQLAVQRDSPAELRQLSNQLEAGNRQWESWLLTTSGELIAYQGPIGQALVPSDRLGELPMIRERYCSCVGHPASVGVGLTLQEAEIALKAAGFRGGDRIVLYTPEVLEEVKRSENPEPDPLDGLAKADPGPSPGEATKVAQGKLSPSAVQPSPPTSPSPAQMDPGLQLKQGVVQVLMEAKKAQPALEQMRQQNPQAYEVINGAVQAMIEMAKVLFQQPVRKSEAIVRGKTRHPLAYAWHDGHTDHYLGQALQKDDRILPHPHTDGAIPNQPPAAQNDQAVVGKVQGYHDFAKDYGTIRPGVHTDLKHYAYTPEQLKGIDSLVKQHGYQVYLAGGKYGKPDLAARNYNTKHLMVYDPTPESGGDFGDEQYTKGWRSIHELAHALTYPELNQMYGEGRRIGKLGQHRTPREAKRAVHWEWLAAHKQRELGEQLGHHVPDHVFNKELNTVMHDAVHRAVTGKFTNPDQEGFEPHPVKVPLEHALGRIDQEAKKMGLQHDSDLIKKPDAVHKGEETPGEHHRSEETSSPDVELVPQDLDKAALAAHHKGVKLPPGAVHNGKIKIVHGDGRTSWASVRAGQILSDDGHPVSPKSKEGK